MSPRERDAPTLAAVAAAAGVSVATVSKVLNGRADVGARTRSRVEAILEEQQYVARRRDPSRQQSTVQPTVELLFHGPITGYSMEILHGALEAGTEAHVSVAVSARPHKRGAGMQTPAALVRDLLRQGRRAVVDVVDDVRQGDLSALAKATLPLVVIDPLSLPHRDVVSVGTTNFSGGLAATEHLLSLGHRRIAYLDGVAGAAYSQARLHGYRAALEAAGVEVPAEYVRKGGARYEDGLAGGAALFTLRRRPTAVFVATDEAAAGVLEAARTSGLRVPDDVSIVGFDDSPLARLLSPPLTTVRQPLREMGRVAVTTALRLAAGERVDSHHVELATELVVRESTAEPSTESPAGPRRAAARPVTRATARKNIAS